jgi:trigger factor
LPLQNGDASFGLPDKYDKMNISQEKIDNLNAVVKININPEDYQPRVEKAIKDHAKKAKIPGFRAGMVPASHIKKMYGKSILVDEINNMLSDTLNKYLEDEKLEVLGQPLPKIEDEKSYNWDFADDFEFKYEVGLAPAFSIDFSSKDKLTQ